MDFNMFMAGKIQFGPGVSARVGETALSLGAKRAVVVTDETMERLGTAGRIMDILQESGIDACLFSGVEPEPSVETTDAVAELAREHDCQAAVGLGGGSSMDVAKAVGMLITNEGSAADYQGLGLVKSPGVPTIMIPTTAGTGSEVTFTSVLIRKSDGVKGGINDDKLYPDVSLLDPELTLSLPPFVTAATGMDAMTHALEAFTSRQASPFSDMFARESLKKVGRWLKPATYNGKSIEARSEMMLAALYGGVALASAGVGACHALAYPLGGMFGVGHGVANALLIPYVVSHNSMALPERYAEAASLLGAGDMEGMSLFDMARACADLLEEMVDDLELPSTLDDLEVGITEEHFEEMSEKAMKVSRPMENNPRVMTEEDCESIYMEAMY
ncbi:MAG: iron-containing alcohol dehydrogenase [Synergistota bacterium]|nr:iron-containing alcohol dehydrogenase [Synergistota bacterium]